MTIKRKNTTITIEVDKLIVSRIIGSKSAHFYMNVDGTIQDLLAKCDKVVELSDDMFDEFARIYKSSLEVGEDE